jgi:hypothetical protein
MTELVPERLVILRITPVAQRDLPDLPDLPDPARSGSIRTVDHRGVRRAVAVVVALAALLTTAGCGSDARVPSAPEAGSPHTAVTPRQAVAILRTVDATLVRAVQARDAQQFGGRATGPAREALAASITVQGALKQTPSVPPAPSTPRLMLTPAGGWPRWFLAAGSSPASTTPLLEVLRSPDARSPYGLWGQLRLLPGAALPEVASATVGAPTLAPDATGLAATPQDTVARYADLLNRGDASSYTGQFTADPYRRELTEQLGSDRQSFASKGVGQVLAAHAVEPGSLFAMRTQDGGALVVGRIDERYTATVTPGKGSVQLDPSLAVLAGRATISRQLERRSVEVVAFHVPRAGTNARITLVAASKADVSATGS